MKLGPRLGMLQVLGLASSRGCKNNGNLGFGCRVWGFSLEFRVWVLGFGFGYVMGIWRVCKASLECGWDKSGVCNSYRRYSSPCTCPRSGLQLYSTSRLEEILHHPLGHIRTPRTNAFVDMRSAARLHPPQDCP